MTPFKVLSTKKLAPHLVKQASEEGIQLIQKSFITIQPTLPKAEFVQVIQANKSLDSNTAITFTSANAVKYTSSFFKEQHIHSYNNCNIFCLESQTKQAVIHYFSEQQILDTAPNAKALADKIIKHINFNKVLFFCGESRRDELPRTLQANNIEVVEIVIYKTMATPQLQAEHVDAVLFFSPSAVDSFFSINNVSKQTVCVAIGQTTATIIKKYTNNCIIVSKQLTQTAMLSTIKNHFQNINH